MKTIAYLRVSTDEQAQSGLGLEAQLDAITKTFGTPDAVFSDEGYSGSDPKRPALLQALESLSRGDVLAVAKRDRLARSVYLSAWLEKEAKKRGARIQSASGEGTETDDPANILMRHIVDAFAEYERAMIGVRTASALAVKKAKGEKTGGDIPYGFSLDADGVHLIPNDAEQKVIALMNDLQAEGLSLRQIAKELEARGYLKRNGKQWHPQTVKNTLQNVA